MEWEFLELGARWQRNLKIASDFFTPLSGGCWVSYFLKLNSLMTTVTRGDGGYLT